MTLDALVGHCGVFIHSKQYDMTCNEKIAVNSLDYL